MEKCLPNPVKCKKKISVTLLPKVSPIKTPNQDKDTQCDRKSIKGGKETETNEYLQQQRELLKRIIFALFHFMNERRGG
jgi:hypothetical protein